MLWGTWAMGRIAIFFSAGQPPTLIAALDLSFLVLLMIVLGREIIAGRNWRNLKVLVLAGLLLLGNAVYHLEMMNGGMAHDSLGLRIGLASVLLLITAIGGRIIPSFTRNWLVRREPGVLPVPFDGDDKVIIAATALALVLWVAFACFHRHGHRHAGSRHRQFLAAVTLGGLALHVRTAGGHPASGLPVPAARLLRDGGLDAVSRRGARIPRAFTPGRWAPSS